MARPTFPKSLLQFQSEFATEEACQQYLTACRWPDGFVCPRCRHRHAYNMEKQRLRQCAACRHQVSLADVRDGAAQYANPAHGLVLGWVPDDN